MCHTLSAGGGQPFPMQHNKFRLTFYQIKTKNMQTKAKFWGKLSLHGTHNLIRVIKTNSYWFSKLPYPKWNIYQSTIPASIFLIVDYNSSVTCKLIADDWHKDNKSYLRDETPVQNFELLKFQYNPNKSFNNIYINEWIILNLFSVKYYNTRIRRPLIHSKLDCPHFIP